MDKTNQKLDSTAHISDGVFSVSEPTPASIVAQTANAPRGYSLTKREQEVLELIAFGLSNKDIARRLTLGRRTVETHVDHVLRKLDVPTRSRAVSEGVRVGLLGGALASAPASSRDAHPNNLPYQLTTLVGREHDLAELISLLEANHLVTLSGSGGVGKTRLALRVGVDLLDSYSEGIWFCDLSPISNAEFVANVVAKVLGVHQRPNRPPADSIVHALNRKHALLIFDNCEHVVDAVAALADEILHNCPNIRILATSRQSLGIIGEVVYRLPSLALPETTDNFTANRAISYAAIALFLDRAQVSGTRFTLTDDNAPVVAEICRRLDGIPLAIELAATRVNVVSVQRLGQSLDDRFKVLTASNRTALPRHKTLATLIDWSYDLLTAHEKQLFKRMGIFAGGCSLDAAIKVCGGDDIDEHNIWDLLSSLTDKSLVMANTGGNQERYRLLESTRAYALDKLAEGDELGHLSRRYAEYFHDEAVEADSNWGTGSTAACLARMELELDNYRATLEWALTNGSDAVLGGAVAGALWRLWFDGGLAAEGRSWIDRAQVGLDESGQPLVAARLWLALSLLSSGKEKHDCAQRAHALYEKAGEDQGIAWALVYLAFGLFQMGHVERAADANARGLELMRKCGDNYGTARSLSWAAMLSQYCSGIGSTRELFAEALDTSKAIGDEAGTAHLLVNMAEMEFADGHVEQAMSLVGEVLQIQGRGRNTGNLPIAYCNMAAYSLAVGELAKAHEALHEAMRFARQSQDTLQVASALQHFALLGAFGGQVYKAARLIGYVNLQFEHLGIQRESTEQWGYDKLMAVLLEHLSGPEIEKLRAEGAEWSEDRAIDEALRI